MNNTEVFLHASEHLFNLGLSETLMLRNYARVNNFKFCSMIGGSESIRDMYEANNLNSEAFEFTMVESLFSIRKIFSSIEKVFVEPLDILKNAKIFINISTLDGIDMISELGELRLPNFLERTNIVFNFERRSIAKIYNNLKDSNFEYLDYEDKINPIIYNRMACLNNLNYKTSLSGGIDRHSIEKIIKEDSLPTYIKTGLFSLPCNQDNRQEIVTSVRTCQVLEAKFLQLMKDSLYHRYDYINKRQMHLFNYLVDSIV